jgi:phospholipid/cholesterol/gamma-HCH transport system permease protein
MNPDPFLNAAGEAGQFRLVASGAWVATNANALEARIEDAALRGPQPAALDIGAVEELDVFGAWLLERLVREAQQKGLMLRLEKVPERFRALLDGVRRTNLRAPPAPAKRGLLSGIEGFGRSVAEGGADLLDLAATLGALAGALGRVAARPRRLRLTSVVHHLDRVGWQAVPIVLLITFLIGCIIAQQGIFHFRKFGADDYVVDLVGILILREIGVLLVAIMVAGRSGSRIRPRSAP